MTYLAIAQIQASASLHQRLIACAAEQKVPEAYSMWVDEHSWDLAAQPGWADAWASAQASHSADADYDPGSDEAVITDAQILAAVQALNVAPVQAPEEASS